jgi:hypothetical protein
MGTFVYFFQFTLDYFWGCHSAKFRPKKILNGGNKMDETFEMDEYCENQETFDTLRFLFQTSKGKRVPMYFGKMVTSS